MDKLCKIKANKGETVEYVAWQLVESPYQSLKKSSEKRKNSKVSCKNVLVLEKLRFLEDLKFELRQEHLNHCHDQFNAFKGAREDVPKCLACPTHNHSTMIM